MSLYEGTIVCPACSAPASKKASACAYCGAQIVLPAPKGSDAPAQRRTFCVRCGQLYPSPLGKCPRCPPSSNEMPAGRCPRCRRDLEPMRMGTAIVDKCPGCGGHWFDGDEIEHAADLTTQGVSREEAAGMRRSIPAGSEIERVVKYLRCVRCDEVLSRRQVVQRAGIIIDVCRVHGVWFDGGELEKFLAFVRAGGLEVNRVDGVAQVEARRKYEEERLRAAQSTGGLPIDAAPRIDWVDSFFYAARALRRLWR